MTGLCANIAYTINQPVVDGECTLNLTETMTCDSPDSNLFATIAIMDGNKRLVAQELTMQPINAKDPWSFQTEWGYLVITGEHSGGEYVQFSLGSESWTSKDTGALDTDCMVGAWTNGWTIPNCNSIFQKKPSIVRIIICC